MRRRDFLRLGAVLLAPRILSGCASVPRGGRSSPQEQGPRYTDRLNGYEFTAWQPVDSHTWERAFRLVDAPPGESAVGVIQYTPAEVRNSRGVRYPSRVHFSMQARTPDKILDAHGDTLVQGKTIDPPSASWTLTMNIHGALCTLPGEGGEVAQIAHAALAGAFGIPVKPQEQLRLGKIAFLIPGRHPPPFPQP